MFRTPAKAVEGEKSPSKLGAVALQNVRRSIGEWEATDRCPIPPTIERTLQAGPAKTKTRSALLGLPSQESKAATGVDDKNSPPKPKHADRTAEPKAVGEWKATKPTSTDPTSPIAIKTVQAGPSKAAQKPPQAQENKTLPTRSKLIEVHSPPKQQFADRSSEARACLNKAKTLLSTSRNTKTEIKNGITEALDRLYQLVKEADRLSKTKSSAEKESTRHEADVTFTRPTEQDHHQLEEQIKHHSVLLENNSRKMEELRAVIEQHKEILENSAATTYASVAATHGGKPNPVRSTLHSIVVTSKDETETGDEVLSKVREAVDAKEGWVRVEKVRKAKDRKIIMGFQTTGERDKIKNKLVRDRQDLNVEEVKNRDPLLVLRSVLSVNSDEDVLKALRNQNKDVFHNLAKEEDRVVVKFRKRTRNPHTSHIVVSVSPTIWKRATEVGCLHVDLQRVRVEDQTPLVQCTRCLGYGHGRRFCKEPADLCSHCGGVHLRSECADFLAGEPPKCQNCTRAKLGDVDHNAFSTNCPIRHRWDEIARSTVAYC